MQSATSTISLEKDQPAPEQDGAPLVDFAKTVRFPAQDEPAQAPLAQAAPPVAAEEDQSLELYMADLLKRVGATSEASSFFADPAKTVVKSEIVALTPVDAADPPPAPEPLIELPPPSAAPKEGASTMASLREVSNQHTRGALDSHVSRLLVGHAYGVLVAALGFMVIAVLLSRLTMAGPWISGVAARLVACFAAGWLFRYWRLVHHLNRFAVQRVE